MMNKTFLLLFATLFLLSCEKDEKKTYTYWSNLVSEKYGEIHTLTQSVPCTDIEEFEIVHKNGYHLVHPSIKEPFDQLMEELAHLQSEAGKAAAREGIYYEEGVYHDTYDMPIPNPPLRKECVDGKPKLVFAQELSLEEINEELPVRYDELENFYNDVPCTDAAAWSDYFLRTGCCMEGIAVHKTIRTAEMLEKIHIYNRLMEKKLSIEKADCINAGCHNVGKPVQCIDGKPVVEMSAS